MWHADRLTWTCCQIESDVVTRVDKKVQKTDYTSSNSSAAVKVMLAIANKDTFV